MNIASQSKIIMGSILATFLLLNILGKVDQRYLLIVALFILGYLVVELLVDKYLNYILVIRNTTYFPDNRTANFMTWDMLKFILILLSIVSVLILGLNKILNNETIATLLGGLVGSLLTLKGSYSDLVIDKDTQDQLNNARRQNQTEPDK